MTSDGLSAEEQLKTKKSTKGRARLTELKERLEAASDVLTKPTMQHYLSIYRQANTEVSSMPPRPALIYFASLTERILPLPQLDRLLEDREWAGLLFLLDC